MAINVNAAEAAVQAHHDGAEDTGAVSEQGSFRGRAVTESPPDAQPPPLSDAPPVQAHTVEADQIGTRTVRQSRPESPTDTRSDSVIQQSALRSLAIANEKVLNIQGQVWRASQLLRTPSSQVPGNKWRILEDLIAAIEKNLKLFDDSWITGCIEETEQLLGPSEVKSAQELRQFLDDTRETFKTEVLSRADAEARANAEARTASVRSVATIMPEGSTQLVEVESRIVPGIKLGLRFESGYVDQIGERKHRLTRFGHVPDLEQTVLTNADGEVLFSGLRHSFIPANRLTREWVINLSKKDLRELVVDLSGPHPQHIPKSNREALIERSCSEIKNGPPSSERTRFEFLQTRARVKMAQQAMAAALVTDPEKLSRALDGETVDLQLFLIALIGNDADHRSWQSQHLDFKRARQTASNTLRVLDGKGDPHTVKANVEVLQFPIWIGDNRVLPPPPGMNDQGGLLGIYAVGESKSAVEARATAMRKRAKELNKEIAPLGPGHVRTVQKLGIDHPDSLSRVGRLHALGVEMNRLEKNASALENAGRQLKAVFSQYNHEPVGVEIQRQVAARIALIAHLMGATPIVSCAPDTQLAMKLDPEIKFLATVADSRAGLLPPIEDESGLWRPARGSFQPH